MPNIKNIFENLGISCYLFISHSFVYLASNNEAVLLTRHALAYSSMPCDSIEQIFDARKQESVTLCVFIILLQ